MFRITLTLLAIAGILLTAWIFWFARPRSEDEKFAAFEKREKAEGGVLFRTQIEGRSIALLLKNCKVYLLDASGKQVERKQVLQPGFYLWFSGCVDQNIRAENGFIRVMLRNQAFGAGGGNASGGDYRSRDGVSWEKLTEKGWLALEKAQD